LVEKRRVSLPNEIDRIFRCSNPECVTNSNEHIESIMDVLDNEMVICMGAGSISNWIREIGDELK